MAVKRVTTGIPGLDEVFDGGIPKDRSYLLLGAAGTGKTLTSVQWLLEGEKKGETALFVTLAEPFDNMQRNLKSFGWDITQLEFVDLNPVKDDGRAPEEYSVFAPSEVESASMWQGIYDAVEKVDPDRVAIDSLTQLYYLSTGPYQFRKQLLSLVSFLHRRECTTLMTFEPAELEDEASVALAVDGIIKLRMEVSSHRLTGMRSIEVEKLRGSGFMSGYHPMRITDEGIKVYPHRVERPSDVIPGERILSSGIERLDQLIGGGLESGTITMLSGPCGAGKTSLGMNFMVESAQKGERALVYTFEEPIESIVSRSESLGQPAREMRENGLLRLVRVNPMELYPDEFLEMVRSDVEEWEAETVLVDSLRGYGLAMEEFGTLGANLHNLVTYLNSQNVTTVITNELEKITGELTATEVGEPSRRHAASAPLRGVSRQGD